MVMLVRYTIKTILLLTGIMFILSGLATNVNAQVAPYLTQTQTYTSWKPGSYATLTAGAASSNVSLGSAPNLGPVAYVCNSDGTNPVFVLLGGAAVSVSATTGQYVRQGTCMTMYAVGSVKIAAIAPSGSPVLYISTGFGKP